MNIRGPRQYHSYAEFEREEIRPHTKAGWSLDDLYAEAAFKVAEDDPFRSDRNDLNFDEF